MAHTSHGHHIAGTIDDHIPRPVHRCGGPGMCKDCSAESVQILAVEEELASQRKQNFMDVVDIGPQAFATGDLAVINYKGENYYKSCGEFVSGSRDPDEASTLCVKRVDHPGWEHEDWDGNLRDRDTSTVVSQEEAVLELARKALQRTGLEGPEVYNALNAFLRAGIKLSKG